MHRDASLALLTLVLECAHKFSQKILSREKTPESSATISFEHVTQEKPQS